MIILRKFQMSSYQKIDNVAFILRTYDRSDNRIKSYCKWSRWGVENETQKAASIKVISILLNHNQRTLIRQFGTWCKSRRRIYLALISGVTTWSHTVEVEIVPIEKRFWKWEASFGWSSSAWSSFSFSNGNVSSRKIGGPGRATVSAVLFPLTDPMTVDWPTSFIIAEFWLIWSMCCSRTCWSCRCASARSRCSRRRCRTAISCSKILQL